MKKKEIQHTRSELKQKRERSKTRIATVALQGGRDKVSPKGQFQNSDEVYAHGCDEDCSFLVVQAQFCPLLSFLRLFGRRAFRDLPKDI